MTNCKCIHKYVLNAAVLFISVLLVSCGGGEARSNANPVTLADNIPPIVLVTSPSDQANGFSVNSSISATFSEVMTASTVLSTGTFTLTTATGAAVSGTVSYTGTTATFKPSSNLASNTAYIAAITTAAKDLAGNAMVSAKTWGFTTGSTTDTTRPTVESTSPAVGANSVATNATVTATFSETMDAATIDTSTFTLTGTAGAVEGTVGYNGTTATFTPKNNLSNTTTYTATITSGVTDAAGNHLAADSPWTFTTAATPPATGVSNLMGINIGAPLYYEGDRLYADVVRMSNNFTGGTIGTDGWPTSDFSFIVWADMVDMDGTYTLTFNGSATVQANGTSLPTTYNSGTNTSTGTLHFSTTGISALTLSFSGTKRTNTSNNSSGVTSIKLMRPSAVGSTTSYSSSTLFSSPIKALIAKFSVIRFMDFLATNTSIQTDWSSRMPPTSPSFNRYPSGSGWQGLGGPWEHVILLSNETGKDAWINIPMHATDDYITKVAQMFKYGSNGDTPYTSTQTNPVYPPLNANLNIYVEYSNELWNGIFPQTNDNCQAAIDELVRTSGNTPINWDATWNGTTTIAGNWKFCDRQTTKRSVEISDSFRSVFGNSAMGTRIRPVLMSQLYNSGATLFNQTQMMFNFYNGMAVSSTVTLPTPHPPSYYFYAAGGSSYYSPATTVSTLPAFFADLGFTPAGMKTVFLDDTRLVAAMGLKRIAYEGGPDLDVLGGARDSIYMSAVNDPRMTNAIVNMHNEWSSDGGDLLVYYRSTGYRATASKPDDCKWGFTLDVNNLASMKLLAIDALNAVDRAPLTFGTLAPNSVSGTAADACSRGWGCSPIPSYSNFTADGSSVVWASYSFRSDAAANWTVNLSFASASGASVAVYVDGTLIGTQSTTGGALTFNAGTVGSGLHGVVVRAVAGTFSLGNVSVALN